MCTTYRHQNLAHDITSRLDPCASYRALWRGQEYSLKEWLHGGGWMGETGPFGPPFSLYKICLDCRNRRGHQRKKAHWKCREKTSGTNQPMENNNKLRLQRLVCVIQDLNAPVGSNINVSFLSSLRPCCIIFSSRSDTWFCENLRSLSRSVQKYGTVTSANAIIPILMLKYYLYMYMYCIL